jgi:hypothetical protein
MSQEIFVCLIRSISEQQGSNRLPYLVSTRHVLGYVRQLQRYAYQVDPVFIQIGNVFLARRRLVTIVIHQVDIL